ncbi:MAG: extracellular solute-binding protein [Actinomycetes bacterium]
MRRWRAAAALVPLVAVCTLLLGACGGRGAEGPEGRPAPGATSPVAGDATTPPRPNADLVIWADQSLTDVVTGLAQAYGKANDLTVAVQSISDPVMTGHPSRTELDPFLAANASGKGPDVVMGPAWWIGSLVQNGAINPVRLTETDQQWYSGLALKAVTYSDKVYGLPYAYESVGLFRNTDLVDRAPNSLEELGQLAASTGAEHPLCLPVGKDGDVYSMYPVFSPAGGYVFGTRSDGSYSPADLGIAKRGSLQAARRLAYLGKAGVLTTSISTTDDVPMFIQGRCPFLVAGPEAVPQVRAAGMHYAITPMVGFAGLEPARPLVDVQAFFVASKGAGRGDGQRFVLDAANSPEAMTALYSARPRPPAMAAVLQQVSSSDADTASFAAAASAGQVLPAVPQMAAVWGPLGRAEAAIVEGADPTTTMSVAATEVAEKMS